MEHSAFFLTYSYIETLLLPVLYGILYSGIYCWVLKEKNTVMTIIFSLITVLLFILGWCTLGMGYLEVPFKWLNCPGEYQTRLLPMQQMSVGGILVLWINYLYKKVKK